MVTNIQSRRIFNGEDKVASTTQLVDAYILGRSFDTCLLLELAPGALNICLVELTVALGEGPLLATTATDK